MKKFNSLQFFQLIAFLIVTIISINLIIYFPNMPPAIKHLIGKYRVSVIDPEKKPNKRFLEWFNRDPERTIPNMDNIIVSPADGIVEKIFVKGKSKHIVIEMRYTDVHVQRVPVSGTLLKIYGGGREIEPGYNLLDYELDKMLPFQKITVFETEIGEITVRQITSFFAKRIEVFLTENQQYQIGTRLGRVLAGSTVVVELPADVEILVKEKDEVLGGETIIAQY